jgi:hypothetical protein
VKSSLYFAAGHADATSVLLQVCGILHMCSLLVLHSAALTSPQLGANIKVTSAGFPAGIERIVTSAECSEVLANWKRRDQ